MDNTVVYKRSEELIKKLDESRAAGKSIGFVPTMGALHEGHLALVKRALADCDEVVVSIFVNPTQFNNPVDLEKYPRMVDKDVLLLSEVGNVHVFAPDYSDVYPEGEEFYGVNLGNLEKVLEGEFRPGHFQGVVHVVRNLFAIVKPNKAYFGLKDFQQVAVIKRMVKELALPVVIVECPTHREENGLAMSSRNLRLSDMEKEEALIIFKTLEYAQSLKSENSPKSVKELAKKYFAKGKLELEYLEIVDGETLEILNEEWSNNSVCCIAAYCGPVRLIDNMKLD